MSALSGWKKNPFWIRLLHWEYWSFSTIYIPIYPIFIFLCLRARSFFFFSAANPKIRNGGFLGESKRDIYPLVPEALQPKTIFFPYGSSPKDVSGELIRAGFQFPLIGKPDMGGKGRGIKKLDDEAAVREYAAVSGTDFHIQEFVPYPNEAGIFYCRFPHQDRGFISGIVHKEFLKVKGNGKQNIRDLLKSDPRAILQIPQLELKEPALLEQVVPADEIFTVVPYGNHARGALFLDDSSSINQALTDTMNRVCNQIPDFYFGRLDIKYESRQLLEEGKSFSIIEVNGAGSEPTHIYDPGHSLFFAWKEIIRHWLILYRISRASHRLGNRYLSLSEGLQMFRTDRENSKKLAATQIKTI
jgi:hypothetical protein